MEVLIAWFQEMVKSNVPEATATAVFALGAVVASIVAIVRTVWKTTSDSGLIALVCIVSLAGTAVVFAQTGISVSTAWSYWLLASACVAGSAVFQHQALKKVVVPVIQSLSKRP